ncbi:phosphocholine cytidylyltransferase family protein [Marine Group I thaumarchaeote]|uniref:Phosphocholine cytidylyltransferase family protein n=1 Tax=Marine Group I thaumarchaeote TaxID=2511932 RepID=A0A7K4NKA5_9ARCH|nr:phosphocholine cytidylyltransferase family protein [Marine Group I thaumarchaeote]
MKAIIVAAGTGSRLGELAKDTPKSLIDVNGQSILKRQISVFKKLGISDITVIIGPHTEKFTFKNISFIQDKNYLEHDILSSLMLARSIMHDDIIVSYGDVIFDEHILQSLINFKGSIGLCIDLNWEKNYDGKKQELKQEATTVQIKNNMCTKIVDGRELAKSKIKGNSKYSNYKRQKLGEFVGLMRLSKHGSTIFIKRYEELINSHIGPFHEAPSISQAYFTDMLQELIDNDTEILPIPVQGKWCEIDTIEDLKRAEGMF